MICGTLRVHFVHRHVQDTIVVLEEGNHPLLCCPKCDIFVTFEALNVMHWYTAM